MALIALPESVKNSLPESGITDWLQERQIIRGLDLQGGIQLDYRIDLRQAYAYNNDDDPENDVEIREIIDGVKATVERRVNRLGLSEPNVYVADIGDETHIITELAGIQDVDEALETIGKTIQLEFKVREPVTAEKIEAATAEAKIKAEAGLELAKAEEKEFRLLGLAEQTSNGRVSYSNEKWFKDEVPDTLHVLWDAEKEKVYDTIIEARRGLIYVGQNTYPNEGYYVAKPITVENVERTVTEPAEGFGDVAKEVAEDPDNYDTGLITKSELDESIAETLWALGENELTVIEQDGKQGIYRKIQFVEPEDKVKASHVLIGYEGALRVGPDVTRTKEEAETLAREVLQKAQAGENFEELALEYSDESVANESKGDLGEFGRGQMVEAFDKKVFEMPVGIADDIIETDFGYHVINKTEEIPAGEEKAQFHRMTLKDGQDAETVQARLKSKEVTKNEDQLTVEFIFYTGVPDDWAATGLDGRHFSRAKVAYDQIGNQVVLIEFDDEGGRLFEELTESNIGEQIGIFVGGTLVSAPRVNEKIAGGVAQISGQFTPQQVKQLKNDLNTGAIAAPIILERQQLVGAQLGERSLDLSIQAGIIGLLILAIYMILYYRLLGVLAVLALIIYATVIAFVLKSSSLIGLDIVVTLAGMAGIILSVGMAVDANVLIFERMKEELRNGRDLQTAIQIGFERAWTSIRDSNLTTLLICFVLSWFGASTLIQGFAIMLALGVIVSMLTAITVTRTFLYVVASTGMRKWGWLYGVRNIES